MISNFPTSSRLPSRSGTLRPHRRARFSCCSARSCCCRLCLAMSRLFIGCSAAKFARVKATTDYWGRCIDQPILISGNIPCTARGKERGTSGTISGNCTFRVSGAEPVLSARRPDQNAPLLVYVGQSYPRAALRRPGKIEVPGGSAMPARPAAQHADHRSGRQAACRCDADRCLHRNVPRRSQVARS